MRKWILSILFCIALFSLLSPCTHAQEKRFTQYTYVPIDNWDAVVAKQPKGVWLSYREYLDLIGQPAKSQGPKDPVVVHKVDYHARVEANALHVDVEMWLSSVSDKPEEYRFSFGPLGIARATWITESDPTGEDAILTVEKILHDRRKMRQRGQQARQAIQLDRFSEPKRFEYTLTVPKKGEHRLLMSCYYRLASQREWLSAQLVLGHFPQQVFYLDTMPGMEYITNPPHQEIKDEKGQRQIAVYLGKNDSLGLSFRPREKKDVKQPVVLAHVYSSHLIEPESITSWFQVDYSIYHQPQKTFQILLPLESEIAKVDEKRWEVKKEKSHQRLIIQLDKEMQGNHTVTIKCRRRISGDGGFALPAAIVAGDILYQDGVTYVEKSPEIKLKTITLDKVRQINPHNLAGGRKDSPYRLRSFNCEPFLGCASWGPDYRIDLSKELIVPEVESSFVSAITIYPDLMETAADITFDVTEGKVKLLKILLPKGWELSRTQTYFRAENSPVFANFAAPSPYITDCVLNLPLSRRVSRGEKVKVSLLLKSTVDFKKWDGRLPLVKPLDCKYRPAFVGVIADPDYKVKLATSPPFRGMKLIDLNLIRSLKIESDNLCLGLKLTEENAAGSLKLEKKQAQISAVSATYLSVEPERLRCAIVLAFDIEKSSRDSFCFAFPLWFKELLEISDSKDWVSRVHISDEHGWIKEIQVPGENSEKLEWSVHLQKKVIGSYSLFLSYDAPMRTQFTLPPISVGDAQVKGVIAIAAGSEAEIDISSEGLHKMSVDKLPIFYHPKFPVNADFLHAFKYTNPDYRLSLGIRFYDKVELPPAILTDVSISTFIPESGRERVYCEYHLNHSGMQFFKLDLPDKADFWSAIVDGKGEKSFRQDNAVAIPLSNKSSTNVVKVVYEREIDKLSDWGKLRLQRPKTDAAIPIKELSWQVYLPRDYRADTGQAPSIETLAWYRQITSTATSYQQKISRSVSMPMSGSAEKAPGDYAKRMSPMPGSSVKCEEAQMPREQLAQELKKQNRLERSEYERRRLAPAKTSSSTRVRDFKRKHGGKSRYKGKKPQMPPMPLQSDIAREENRQWAGEEPVIAPEDDEIVWDEATTQADPQSQPPGLTGKLDRLADKDNDYSGLVGNQPDFPKPALDLKSKEEEKESWENEWGDDTGKILTENITDRRGRRDILVGGTISEENAKARGLRSLEMTLFGDASSVQPAYRFSVNDYVDRMSRELSPISTPSLEISYVRQKKSVNLSAWLTALATICGLLLLTLSRKAPVPVLITLVIFITFIPWWSGQWLMPYCNALVWGLLLSAVLAAFYKSGRAIGVRMGLIAALILVLGSMSFDLCAQPKGETVRIFIPYHSQDDGKVPQIKDVFIPYQHYLELWNNAHPDRQLEVRTTEIDDFILYHATYQGEMLAKTVKVLGCGASGSGLHQAEITAKKFAFSAQFLVEVRRGPIEIPVGLKGVAIERAMLSQSGETRSVTLRPTEDGYRLIVPSGGTYKVDIRFLPQVPSTFKEGELSFGIVPVATSVFCVKLDSNLGVDVPGHRHWYENVEGGVRTVTLFPGLAKKLSLKWFPDFRRYQAQGTDVRAFHDHELTLRNHVLTLNAKINYAISGKCDRLKVYFPGDYTITDLVCNRAEQWILARENGRNEIVLRLKEDHQSEFSLRFTAVKTLAKLPARESYPDIVPVGATEETGKAALIYHNAYDISVSPTPNFRKSAGRGDSFAQMFRYAEHPYLLEFSVKRQKPDNFVYTPCQEEEGKFRQTPGIDMRIGEEKITIEYLAQIKVQGAPIFSYRLSCPLDFEVTGVSGRQIKTWRVEPDGKRQKIDVIFKSSVQKGMQVRLRVGLERERSGKTVTVPYFDSPQAGLHSGTILVSCSDDLEISPLQEQTGVVEHDISDFSGPAGLIMRYGYDYRIEKGEHPYLVRFAVQPRKPEIEISALIDLLIEDYWLNWAYYINYDIKFAGVDTFVFRLPKQVGENLQIIGENIREIEDPLEVKIGQKQYLEWTVRLHNKVRDHYRLLLFPEIKKNPEMGFDIFPILFPPGGTVLPKLTGEHVFIRVENSSSYELTPRADGVKKSKTPTALLPSGNRTGAVKNPVYEYKVENRKWQLGFEEHKPELVQTVRTAIDAIQVKTVLDEQGQARHRITYYLRCGGQQFLELAGLQEAKIWGVFVGGYYVCPVKKTGDDKKEHVLIPLHPLSPTRAKQQKLTISIVFSQKAPALSKVDSLRLILPRVCNIQEIGDLYWQLYAPQKYLYKFAGNVSICRGDELWSFQEQFRNYSTPLATKRQPKFQQSEDDEKRLRYAGQSNALQSRYNDQYQAKQQDQQRQLEKYNEAPAIVVGKDSELYRNYGRKNLEDIQNAGQYLINVPQGKKQVYQDKNDSLVANESSDAFLRRQAKKAAQMMHREQSAQKNTVPENLYSLYIPSGMRSFCFSKKQGAAELKVERYFDPRHSGFWLTVQFFGFLALMILAMYWQLFSLKGYSLRKIGLSVLIITTAVIWCGLPDFVYNIIS